MNRYQKVRKRTTKVEDTNCGGTTLSDPEKPKKRVGDTFTIKTSISKKLNPEWVAANDEFIKMIESSLRQTKKLNEYLIKMSAQSKINLSQETHDDQNKKESYGMKTK